MILTITVQTEVDGETIASAMTLNIESLESLSCSSGDWFESALASLKCDVRAKATEAKTRQQLNQAADNFLKGMNEQTPATLTRCAAGYVCLASPPRQSPRSKPRPTLCVGS